MSKPNKADLKAMLAKGHASAAGQIPMLVSKPSDMPGWSLWMVGEVMVGMPTLLPSAPKSIRRRYLARIIANATGRCPSCGEVCGDPIDADDESNPIRSAALAHEAWSPVGDDGPLIDRWLDPASEQLRQAVAYQGAP